MKRIHWSEEEIKVLVEEGVRRYGVPKNWSKPVHAVMREVQDHVLTPSRQRSQGSLVSKLHVKTVQDYIDARDWTPAVIQASATPEPAPEPEPKSPSVGRSIFDEVIVPDFSEIYEVPEEPADVDVKDILSTFISDVLVDSIKKLLTNGEIARMLRNLQMGDMPTVIKQERAKHSPEPEQAPRGTRKVILICGFKAFQQGQFLHAFPQLHLKFWYGEKNDRNVEVLRQKAQGADVVLFTMEATGHTAVEAVKAMGKRFIRVTGGASAMTAALNTIVANGGVNE